MAKALSGHNQHPLSRSPQEEKAIQKWNEYIKEHFSKKPPLIPKQSRKRRIRRNEFTGSDILKRDQLEEGRKQLKQMKRTHRYWMKRKR